MLRDSERTERFARPIRVIRLSITDSTIYQAGDEPGPGIYREVERGILVRLPEAIPLPDLNSGQPSSFFRRRETPHLLRWLLPERARLDLSTLYRAGQPVPAGCYQDVERGIRVQLRSDGPLPDLQTGAPSRYLRLRKGPIGIRRR